MEREMRPYLDQLHAAQAGFRHGRNALENLQAVDDDPRPVRVLIDYTKAYDSPNFNNIRLSWQIFGLPAWMQRLLASLYTTSMRCRLCVNGTFGE